MKRNENVNYDFRSLSVPGGGFVTGFIFHPLREQLFARTDIGGIYGFDNNTERWFSINTSLTEFQHHLTCPLSIAFSDKDPDMLFAMCGDCWKNRETGERKGKAAFLISNNCGKNFTEKEVPFHVNGNAPARGSGERLAYKDGRLFFGSQEDGLWLSDDMGDNWIKTTFPGENCAFVFAHPDEEILIISCSGETLSTGNNRAHTLYASYDNGISFVKIHTPAPLNDSRCDFNGFVADGIAHYGNKIYITFTHSYKTSFGRWNCYACDNGGGFDGRAFVYEINNGKVVFSEDITPVWDGFSDENSTRKLPFGLGGVDVYKDNIVLCSVGGHGDGVFISRDGGKAYDIIKSTDISRFIIDVPYQKPQYNGGRIPLHWMSNLRINPHNPDFAVFTTGTGLLLFATSHPASRISQV